MKKLIASLYAVTLVLGAGTLTACNTIEGAGKDIERAGETVQNSNCTKDDAAKDPACK